MAPPSAGETADERRPLLEGSKPAGSSTTGQTGLDPSSGEATQGESSSAGYGSSGAEVGATANGNDVAAKDEADELPFSRILVTMLTVWIGTFLAALDGGMVATIAAPISGSFHSLSMFSWLASGYFIANAAFQPLAGKLTDIFGRRAGLLFCNTVFGIGNLICGLAQDPNVMILGRVVAGLGGGGLNSISSFVGNDLIPLRRRGVWQGVGNIMFGLGSSIGAVFGGWVNDTLGWRWAFLIQVPLSVFSIIMVIAVVRLPAREDEGAPASETVTSKDRWRRVDFTGSFLLVTTLVLMLLGLNSGGNVVPWNHPLVWVSLPLSGVALVAFVYVEAYVAQEPIIPVQLLLGRTVMAACLTNWFTTMAIFGLIFYVPVYFQARSYSATAAGERLITQSVGVAIGSISSGLLMRRLGRYWWVNVGVQAMEVLGFVLLCTLDRYTPDIPPFFYFLLTGAGYSGMLTVTLIALISSVEHRFSAVITSASYAFRSTGSTIGITIASAVFQNFLNARLWDRLTAMDPSKAAEYVPRVRESLDEIFKLPDVWRDAVVDCYIEACRAVFITLLGLMALGAGISLFMRDNKLHSTISRRDS